MKTAFTFFTLTLISFSIPMLSQSKFERIENGFSIVYDKDEEKPLGDGFYFTINYPGFTGSGLMEELLYYGISSVALNITGSTKEGLRACVSQFKPEQSNLLSERLKQFKKDHSQ